MRIATLCSVSLISALLALAPAAAQESRLAPAAVSVEDDAHKVAALLRRIDADVTDTDVYVEDVVHMAQGSRAITSRTELTRVLTEEARYGHSEMTHEIVTLHSYPDIVLVRGRVTGAWRPADGGAASLFETNNMMTFRRQPDGSLKIWHVIFNRVDLTRYPPPANAP